MDTGAGVAMSGRRIAIVGAGAAGLCMAIRLRDAGFSDVVVYERSDGVGGTWRANTYPGAACDIPSHLYSFSFALRPDWSRRFAGQAEILEYFEDLCDAYGLRPLLRTGTEVHSARFDDAEGTWTLTLGDGRTDTVDAVVFAVGQLNRPFVPDLAGLSDFEGDVFHSARWDHRVDLAGKRVGVVGNGASAIQFVPPVAEVASSLTVFQRSANWILPKPDRPYGRLRRRAFAAVPILARLHRSAIYWRFEANHLLLRRSSTLSERLGRLLSRRLRPLSDRGVAREAVVPDYPLGCKRVLLSNDYYQCLTRPDVRVELQHLTRVLPGGVETADGVLHPLDVLIFGTGFAATEFLAPMSVFGRGGRDLNEVWAGGASAHLGMTVHGFPNMFILYGPNTNLGHNSILFMIEAQTRYVAGAIARLRDDDLASLEVRADVADRFAAEIRRGLDRTVWGAGCESWYKNDQGVITNNWPSFTVSYWARLRSRRPWEFVARPRRVEVRT
ncbi:MAG: NAD(P)/FAD-dependent oxidoreductase [Microthrixaceae bacterium]